MPSVRRGPSVPRGVRSRLVRQALVTVSVAVVLLGVPLAVMGVLVVRAEARTAVHRQADALVRVVVDRRSDGRVVDAAALRRVLTSAGAGPGASAVVTAGGRTWSVGTRPDAPLVEGRSRQSSAGVQAVVAVPVAQVDVVVRRVVLAVLGASVVALAAGVGVAGWQARRISAPLEELAAAAELLASGGAGGPGPAPSGLPEVDRVAAGLRRSAAQMQAALAVERDFAADASHQLRTPLAALSMRLEEIAGTDDVDVARDEARIALSQVERLASVVEQLLGRARRSAPSTVLEVDLAALLAQQRTEWRPTFAAHARELVVDVPAGLGVRATPSGLTQVVATLLENSLVHGAGTTTVSARRSGGTVVLEVCDQGEGVPPELGPRIFERQVSGRSGTGLGLSLARDLVEADGGRIELVRARPAVFAVFLSAPAGPGATAGPVPVVGGDQAVPREPGPVRVTGA